MAKPSFTSSSLESPCICFWLSSLAAPVKNSIVQLINTIITAATTIVNFLKLIGTLVTNIDKELKIAGLNIAIDAAKALVRPLEAPSTLVVKLMKPYSDCDYLNTWMSTIKKFNKSVIGPVEKQIRDAEDMVDTLEDDKRRWTALDDALSVMNDFKDAIQNVCGTD